MSQPLFTYNRTQMTIRQLELALENSQINYALRKLSIEQQVTQQFLNLYASRESLKIAEESLKNATESYQIIESKVKAGISAPEELYQADLTRLNSVASLENKQMSYANSLDGFKILIGLPLTEEIEIVADIRKKLVEVDLDKAVAHAQENRMELRQRDISIQNALDSLIRADAENEFKGSVALSLGLTGVNTQFQNVYDSSNTDKQIALSFNIPVFDWGQKQHRLAATQASVDTAAALGERAAESRSPPSIRQAYRNLQNQKRQIEIAEINIKNAERTYEINLERYKNGDLSSKDMQFYQLQLSEQTPERGPGPDQLQAGPSRHQDPLALRFRDQPVRSSTCSRRIAVKKRRLILLGLAAVLALGTACKQESMSVETSSTIPVRVSELTAEIDPGGRHRDGHGLPDPRPPAQTEQAGRYQLRANPRTGVPFRMGDAVRKDEVLVALDNPEFVNSDRHGFEEAPVRLRPAGIHQAAEHLRQGRDHPQGAVRRGAGVRRRQALRRERAPWPWPSSRSRPPSTASSSTCPISPTGGWTASGTLVARIVDYSRLYADLTLPGQGDGPRRPGPGRRGQRLRDGQDAPWPATVTQISPALDATSRMFKLKIEIPNPDLVLKPGSFIKADIVVQEQAGRDRHPQERHPRPRREPRSSTSSTAAWPLERRIKTGIENEDEVEILDGLRAKDQLIIEGFETLRGRSQVKVIQ